MKHTRILLLAALAPVLFTGCSTVLNTADHDSFSCPGMPQGIVCKTPTAVFKSTNQMPDQVDGDLPIGQTVAKAKRAASDDILSAASRKAPPLTKEVALTNFGGAAARGDVTGRPVREPARVMRIWIAPWVDKNDDLHFPSYLYTEVQPRRWSFGKSEFAGAGVVIPHRELAPASATSTVEQPASQRGATASVAKQAPSDAGAPDVPSATEINLN